jgi:hypothetical protein
MNTMVDDWSVRMPGKHWSFRGRGLLASIGIVVATVMVLLSVPMVAEDSWQDEVLDILAWVVFLAGAGLRFWATLYIGGRKEWTLVNDGPYSLCRNPLYVGSLLMLLSIGLLLDSLTFLVVTSAVVMVYPGAPCEPRKSGSAGRSENPTWNTAGECRASGRACPPIKARPKCPCGSRASASNASAWSAGSWSR